MYPDVAPSRLVNTLKTVSSRLIRRDYQEHQRKVLLPKTCSLDGSILHYFDWWRTIRDNQEIHRVSGLARIDLARR